MDTVKISEGMEVELFDYDLIFAGSGVYGWLPGQPVIKAFTEMRKHYVKGGKIKTKLPAHSREKGGRVLYLWWCTYRRQ